MNIERRPERLVKLTGTMETYKATRAEANFVFTDADRTKFDVMAGTAGTAGLSGQAIATASHAASLAEDADYVEFDLDGKPVKGWVWRSPFKEGDAVEVAPKGVATTTRRPALQGQRIESFKSSKAQRKPNAPREYGTFYFRY